MFESATSYWVFNPATATMGNLLIGAGLKLNTGSHMLRNIGLALDPATQEGNSPQK